MCCLSPLVSTSGATSIIGSPHDLSAQSPARIHATSEQRVCIFCHTPHHATKLQYTPEYPGPLWSRQENLALDYIPYESTTIAALPGQPQGASRLCLSCHDGTIALGAPTALGVSETLGTLASYGAPPSPKKTAVLGKNLSDDHPISMEYGLKTEEFNAVDAGLARLLSSRSGKQYVECTSCHSPHDNQYGNFLVKDTSTQKDALCTMCHKKSDWDGGIHKTCTQGYCVNNGCINCHTPHGAQQGVDLLAFSNAQPDRIAPVDSTCVTSSCHVNTEDSVTTEFNPAGRYVHPLTSDNPTTNQHSETEILPLTLTGNGQPALSGSKHVHCIDCHNPHQTNSQNSPLAAINAPAVNGALKGVRGVNISGQAIDANTPPYQGYASNEYQVCLKCHAGSDAAGGSFNGSASSGTYVQRFFPSTDESERFNSSRARSWHPVAATSTGSSSNLRSDNGSNALSYIYCSSCHTPHGSDRQHLLRSANYDTFDTLGYSNTNYALCFGCHDEAWLMDTTGSGAPSGKLHKAHVQGLHDPASASTNSTYWSYKAPCSVCHDPHGVPQTTGPLGATSSADNAAHLINFQQRYVPANATYSNATKTCFSSGTGGDGTTTCHKGGNYSTNYNTAYPYNP